MSVKINGGGFGGTGGIVASTITDSEGHFSVRAPRDYSDRPGLWANSPGYVGDGDGGYNPDYSGGNLNYRYEDRHNLRIQLMRLAY